MDFGSGSSSGSNITKQPSLVSNKVKPKVPKPVDGTSRGKATKTAKPPSPEKDYSSPFGKAAPGKATELFRGARVTGSRTTKKNPRPSDDIPSITDVPRRSAKDRAKGQARRLRGRPYAYATGAAAGATGAGLQYLNTANSHRSEGSQQADEIIANTVASRAREPRRGTASKALAVEAVAKYKAGMTDEEVDRQGLRRGVGGAAIGLTGAGVTHGIASSQRKQAATVRQHRDRAAQQYSRVAAQNPSWLDEVDPSRGMKNKKIAAGELNQMDGFQRLFARGARNAHHGRNVLLGTAAAAIPANIAGNRRAKRQYEQKTSDWMRKNPANGAPRRVTE